MKEFLTKNLVSLIVIGLLSLIYFQRCNQPSVPPAKPDTVRIETIIHHYHDSVIVSKPTIINHILASKENIPAADTNYNRLKTQYDSLALEYYSKNISQDSLKIDSIGTVSTIDSVSQNKIVGRKWSYHLDIKERIIDNYITLPPKLRNQIYIGGGLIGNQLKPLSGIKVGFMLKNKKDQVFGIGVEKQWSQPLLYETTMYWKIKFHK